MKLTKKILKEIIKEEIRNLNEAKMVQLQIKEMDKKKVKKNIR